MKALLPALVLLALSATAQAASVDCHSLEVSTHTGYLAKISAEKAEVLRNSTSGPRPFADLDCENPHDPKVPGMHQIRLLLVCKNPQLRLEVSHGDDMTTAHLFRNGSQEEITEMYCEPAAR